ncbi:MAG: protein phosphatase 2C domain-containing protein [Streptosporangiaceae bacterium]
MHPADSRPWAGHLAGGTGAWAVLTASARGAAHVAAEMPNQDAAGAGPIGTGPSGDLGLVAAVADGHGHRRHPRSARGSRLAVSVGLAVGAEIAGQVLAGAGPPGADPGPDTGRLARLLAEHAAPAIVQRWRAAVLADVAADPLTDAEQDQRPPDDDPAIAYGSTLLLAVVAGPWLLLAQIGDGDVVAVRADGGALLPVPADPSLDGQATTSLCGRHATADFRFAVVDTDSTPLLAVLLGTDGYGNAQVADPWPEAFSRDLATLIRAHDEAWLAGQLPGWAERCASAEGSADDTTVALLIAPAGRARRTLTPPVAPAAAAGSDDPTIPAEARS